MENGNKRFGRLLFDSFEHQLAQTSSSGANAERDRPVIHDFERDRTAKSVVDRRTSHVNHQSQTCEPTTAFDARREPSKRRQLHAFQGQRDDQFPRVQKNAAVRLPGNGFHVRRKIGHLDGVKIDDNGETTCLKKLRPKAPNIRRNVQIKRRGSKLIVGGFGLDNKRSVLNCLLDLVFCEYHVPKNSGGQLVVRHIQNHAVAPSGRGDQNQ